MNQTSALPVTTSTSAKFKLGVKHYGAIKQAIELGVKIIRDYPVIADEYRGGLSAREIVKKHELEKVYGVTFDIAQAAVYYALKGCDGSFTLFDHTPYQGLFPDRIELGKIAKKHKVEVGKKTGKRLRDLKKGVHAHTPKEKMKLGRSISIARGWTSFTDVEFLRIYKLARTPKYQRGSRIQARMIAKAVNHEFHDDNDVRNSDMITKAYIRIKKYIKDGALVIDEEKI